MCQNPSDRDRVREKSLELHERSAQGVDGQRTQRYRFHAVSGRRPGELHGSGHFRAVPGPGRQGTRANDNVFQHLLERDWFWIFPGQDGLRRSGQKRSDERNPEARTARELRRTTRRARHRLYQSDAHGGRGGSAGYIHRSDGDFVLKRVPGPRRDLEPGGRSSDIGRPRRSENVRSTF